MSDVVFVSHASAIYYLTHRGFSNLRKTSLIPSKGQRPSPRQARNAIERLGLPDESHLDVATACQDDRRYSARVRPHLCAYTYGGDYLRFDSEICVAKPELAYLQTAETLSVQELVLLGYELCGCFVTNDGEFSRAAPVAYVGNLKSYADVHRNARGYRKAQRALSYVCDGSASPRESQLAALLCAPKGLGGYGLPLPELNAEIPLNNTERELLSKQRLYCDLLWRTADVAVEYDSDLFHSNTQKINDDSLRRNVLKRTGISVIDVTNTQMRKASALHGIARQISMELGQKPNTALSEKWKLKNKAFHELVVYGNAANKLL